MSKHSMVNSVDAFVHLPRDMGPVVRDGKTEHALQLAIQVNGGRWSQIHAIPRQGSFHGVVRVSKSRWLFAEGESYGTEKNVYELCYVVAPLDGDWGLLTRSLIVTSRFLLRNDSKTIAFEVKQTGASDASSVIIQPGQILPFHWGSYHLPELVSIRPTTIVHGKCAYKWSGGFDPLLIGHVPLRLRKIPNVPNTNDVTNAATIHSVKVEIEIRPRTGGTGINLAFQEEDGMGEGALFRIENLSPFPIWFCQDDVLANPSKHHVTTDYSDIANPSSSNVFSLDIPFKQGKYSHRKAAALTALLRVRLALAPLTTRAGIETTKVLAMAMGESVRLNPSKLMILNPEIRHILQDVRIVGVVINDGPTRVLRLR
jgi:SHR-binding domain of vacuolar-sorting associated protein 13